MGNVDLTSIVGMYHRRRTIEYREPKIEAHVAGDLAKYGIPGGFAMLASGGPGKGVPSIGGMASAGLGGVSIAGTAAGRVGTAVGRGSRGRKKRKPAVAAAAAAAGGRRRRGGVRVM